MRVQTLQLWNSSVPGRGPVRPSPEVVGDHAIPLCPEWNVPASLSIEAAAAHAQALEAPCTPITQDGEIVDLIHDGHLCAWPMVGVLASAPLSVAVEAFEQFQRDVLLVVDGEGEACGVLLRRQLAGARRPQELRVLPGGARNLRPGDRR